MFSISEVVDHACMVDSNAYMQVIIIIIYGVYIVGYALQLRTKGQATVHSEKNELLAFGHKWVKRWVFLEFFSAILYGILFQLCFWSFFLQKASHNKNRISARFCPQSIELGKTIKIQAVWPRLQQCIVRFEPQFRYPFWTLFQISNFAALHCVRWNHEKSPNTGARQSQSPSFYEWTVGSSPDARLAPWLGICALTCYALLCRLWSYRTHELRASTNRAT